jgi:hypothetical protein
VCIDNQYVLLLLLLLSAQVPSKTAWISFCANGSLTKSAWHTGTSYPLVANWYLLKALWHLSVHWCKEKRQQQQQQREDQGLRGQGRLCLLLLL